MRPATPAAAGGGHDRAQQGRKRPGQLPPADGRLLSNRRPRAMTGLAKPAYGEAAWLRFFTGAAPNRKRQREHDGAVPRRASPAERDRHAMVPSGHLPTNKPKPTGPGPPIIQVTFAPPQHTLLHQLQGMLHQALGPLLQRRPPVVVAQAIGARAPVPMLLGPPPGGAREPGVAALPTPIPLRAQLTAAGLREAAQKAALQHPRITGGLAAQRAAAGVPTTLAAIEAADVVFETTQLIVLLPPSALATVCGTSVERLFNSTPQQIVDHALRHSRRRWVSTTIAGARRAYVRLLLWLEAHDIEHDGTVDGLTLGSYLDDVDKTARARCAEREAQLARAGGERPRGKPQTGEHAAQGQWEHLDYLRRRWGLQLATGAAKARYEPARRPPQAAPPPSVRAMFTLEATLVQRRHTLAAPVLNAAAATLFLAYAVSRVEQAQSCYFDGW